MKRAIEIIKSRILKHWQTTLKGIVYAVLTLMFYEGKMNATEWIASIGSILSINAIFLQKDPGKTANKVDDPNIPTAKP
jgi:hypothetical protein